MTESIQARELTDAEMRAQVAALRKAAAEGDLQAESNSKDEILQHLEDERRRLKR
jgi:hypothetical protein